MNSIRSRLLMGFGSLILLLVLTLASALWALQRNGNRPLAKEVDRSQPMSFE